MGIHYVNVLTQGNTTQANLLKLYHPWACFQAHGSAQSPSVFRLGSIERHLLPTCVNEITTEQYLIETVSPVGLVVVGAPISLCVSVSASIDVIYVNVLTKYTTQQYLLKLYHLLRVLFAHLGAPIHLFRLGVYKRPFMRQRVNEIYN
ncbi:hypothetical protein AVEN_175701-1 [Araneus ventricosus]|uniref:Uncharacterized protein n=1 Tax=Araneus ventricosus TaxID=182803 RepID=A0A4Y2LDE3_ARAVE|nr:hypothetical protein AVEN_175701-1 [Araneus ventricosus]